MIKSAKAQGMTFATLNAKKYVNLEEVIFAAMQSNPMKGKKQRRDFIDGVSERINWIGCLRNRKMNEK